MAGNIYGYQGVHTPLESLTQGRYTLADYTTMRTELTSRLIALENQGGFVPTDVEITGYLHMLPGSQGSGEIETTSSITCNSFYANTEAHCGNLLCDTTLICGGIITGDGSGLVNINDVTKLPLAGGSLTGSLIVGGNVTVNGGYVFTGNGSGLTLIDDITKLPLGGTAVAALACPYSGLTGAVPTWNQNTTGNALTATTSTSSTTATNSTNLVGGAGGRVPYQSAASTTSFTAVGTVGQVLTSQAAGMPTWTTFTATDVTKLPLAGGTMTGQINAQDILFGLNYQAFNYKRDRFSSFNNFPAQTYTPLQQNGSVHDYVRLEFNNDCTVDLVALTIINNTYYQDKQRYVTVTKKALSLGPFVVTILPPSGYLFYHATSNGAATYIVPSGVFSVTFLISNFNGDVVDLIASV